MFRDSVGPVKSCPVCKASFPSRTPRCPIDGATLVDEAPALHGGRVFAGRYRMIDRVGAGPSAEVYRATDLRGGAQVAARVPRPDGPDARRRRFDDQLRAFRLAAPHDALVPVLDVLDRAVGDLPVVVTEFVSLTALPQVLAAGPAPLAAALHAAHQLASVLDHLHQRNVLARDLRAGAVFLSLGDPVRVRLSIDALGVGPQSQPEVPAHAAVAYLSPERIRGEPGTAASDVYALAALVFEIVTGHPTYRGTADDVMHHHLHSPAPVLRQVNPNLPRALEALLARMFAKLPRFRPSAAEAAQEIRAMIA